MSRDDREGGGAPLETRADPAKDHYHRSLIAELQKLDAQIVEKKQQLKLATTVPSDGGQVAELRRHIAELEMKRDAFDELLTREGAFPAPQEGGPK